MARRVYYRISDRPDGCFDAIVTVEPDTVVRREGFASLAEVEEWIEGLRALMAALGALVSQCFEDPAHAQPAEAGSSRVFPPGKVRAGR